MITPEGYERFLLVRKSITTDEQAYYSTFAPIGTDIETFVRVSGSRWSVEECFEMAKGETGLDHYEVRTYHGWQRHMVLSMWALYLLVFLKNKMNEKEELIPLIQDAGMTSEKSRETKDASTPCNPMDEFKKKRKILSDLQLKKPHDL